MSVSGAALDRPIREESEDLLGLTPFAASLARTLLADNARQSRGVVLGLEGSWGSGKSSVLNLVEAKLKEQTGDRLVLVRFDPWLVSGRDDLIAVFFRELIDAVDPVRKDRSKVGSAASKLAKYGEMLAPALNLYIPLLGTAVGGAIKATGEAVAPTKVPSELRKDVEALLGELDRPIVVLVDELDRIEDAEVQTVAQLVRSIMDFPKISYLLAYDPVRVSEALGGGTTDDHRGRGQAYLEKIVQLRVPMPATTPERLRKLIEADFRKIMAGSPANDRPPEWDRLPWLLEIAVPGVVATLRDVRRVIGTFAALEPMLRNEVEPVDLLGWSLLVAKTPEIVRDLNDNLELFCRSALLTGSRYLQRLLWTPFGEVEEAPTLHADLAAKLRIVSDSKRALVNHVLFTAKSDHDTLFHKDRLLVVLSAGSRAAVGSIGEAIRACSGQYEDFRDAAEAAWNAQTLAQFLASLRVASWRVPNSLDLRSAIIRLAEDDDAFGSILGRRRRHQLIALGFLVVFGTQSPGLTFPQNDLGSLREAIRSGQIVVASHILVESLQRPDRSRPTSQGRAEPLFVATPVGPFEPEHIEQIRDDLVAWAQERLSQGDLVRSTKDSACLLALLRTDLIDAEARERIWSEVQADDALDHLLGICFDDEPDEDSRRIFLSLFERSADILQRLRERGATIGNGALSSSLARATELAELAARQTPGQGPETSA